MADQLYREIVLEHWKNPLNYGVIKNPDIDIEENNPLCGDEIRITIKTDGKKIKQIAFTSEGCAISTACASMFTEMVKQKSIQEIKKIKPEVFLDKFGICLSPVRIKCALLAYSTLKKGLK